MDGSPPAHPILLSIFNMKELLLIIAWGLYVLWPSPGLAAELTQMQATTIYMLAHSVSGYKLPAIAPEIHLVPIQKLRDMVCPGKTCAVHALQVREKIYLDQDLDMQDIQNASILFHENVHFLQWANKGEAKDCAEWMEREYEAYGLQNHVLEKAGVRLLRLPAMSCS